MSDPTPGSKSSFEVKCITWDSPEIETVKSIRLRVFVDEQKVPRELKIDEIDPGAYHVLATNAESKPCGTGRMFTSSTDATTAKIGRMAVLETYRSTGCGKAILGAIIDHAKKQGYEYAELSAQTHAVGFYEKQGFIPEGPVYDDAGIPHRTMRMKLT